jgi:8-oxo-dGTP pyrophosphatase MutT (NUDIX family)
MKQGYVLGFAFSEDRQQVALITKNKPLWQVGKRNGIGGKIEESDNTAFGAMFREFVEETGVRIDGWELYCTMNGSDWEVAVFRTFTNDIYNVQTTTDEYVSIFDVSEIDEIGAISNVPWLVHLALDTDRIHTVEVFYKSPT